MHICGLKILATQICVPDWALPPLLFGLLITVSSASTVSRQAHGYSKMPSRKLMD